MTSRSRKGAAAPTLAALAAILAGCGGGNTMEEPPPQPVLDPVVTAETARPSTAPTCEPSDNTLRAGQALPSGDSKYSLVMFRGDATSRPAWVAGTLTLEPRPAELSRLNDWSVPLQGTADIDVSQVGAHDTGPLDSEDPRAPGVLVLESGAEPLILLRLGAAANRSDETAFDGAFTVLTVRAVERDGFGGSWRSGSFGDEVRGYFCASAVSM
ncbi:MAG: hypothetical protein HKN72_12765 [Gemmatimonadetes bacterium]|nr:hypothetical protein [Gemmatimonadota bacterium]